MNKIEIKNRFNGDVIYSYECKNNTLKITCVKAVLDKISLRGAYLRGADLRGADLRDADLRGANLRGAYLRGADLRDADLRDAYLRDAYLRGADLRDADLRGADLRGAYLRDTAIVIYGMMWTIQITKNCIKIGCQSHTLDDWVDFDDDKISKMHDNALEFWKENKDFIINKCKELSK